MVLSIIWMLLLHGKSCILLRSVLGYLSTGRMGVRIGLFPIGLLWDGIAYSTCRYNPGCDRCFEICCGCTPWVPTDLRPQFKPYYDWHANGGSGKWINQTGKTPPFDPTQERVSGFTEIASLHDPQGFRRIRTCAEFWYTLCCVYHHVDQASERIERCDYCCKPDTLERQVDSTGQLISREMLRRIKPILTPVEPVTVGATDKVVIHTIVPGPVTQR